MFKNVTHRPPGCHKMDAEPKRVIFIELNGEEQTDGNGKQHQCSVSEALTYISIKWSSARLG